MLIAPLRLLDQLDFSRGAIRTINRCQHDRGDEIGVLLDISCSADRAWAAPDSIRATMDLEA